MTLATLEADVKAAALSIGVDADHLAHFIRHEVLELLHLSEDNHEAAKEVVAASQPDGVETSPSAPAETAAPAAEETAAVTPPAAE